MELRQPITSLFGLRPGERAPALLMALYHFVLLVTLYLLKPVRDSLFLVGEGAAQLPWVFILVAVAVAPISALYDRAGRSLRLGRFVYGVTLFLALNLVALRYLVGTGADWTYFVLYVWVSLYSVLVTSQFWLMANAVFDSAQAKRIFSLLSLGAILGAVAGGEITALLVDRLGMRTENLIWVAAGLLAASSVLVRMVREKAHATASVEAGSEDAAADDGAPADGLFATLRGSRHLQLIVGVIALTVVTTTFIDFQFKTVAAAAFPQESDLTSFMGRFYGRVSLIAFGLQLLFGSKLLQRIGVGGAVLALPAALVAATVGMLVAPGLVAATLLRGTDQSLKHSIDKTGRELLFLPVPLRAKRRVKVFIDLFVDQGAQGLAGLLLLLFTAALGLSVHALSGVVLALLGFWAILAFWARGSYVREFRVLLRRRVETPETETPDEDTALTTEDLIGTLRVGSTRRLEERLERFAEDGVEVPASTLGQLIEHQSARVRRQAIRLLRLQDVPGLVEPVADHLEDHDAEVRLEAARYLYRNLPEDPLPALKNGLEHPDFRVRAAGLGLITKDGGPRERALVSEELLRTLLDYEGEDAEEVRAEVARVLGALDRPYRVNMLQGLLHDPSPQVVRHAIESTGYAGERDFVPQLLKLTQHADYGPDARRALAAYGDRVLGTLYDHLTDEHVSEPARRAIPSILAERPVQASADVLLLALERASLPVRSAIIKALSQLRAEKPSLHFNQERLQAAIREEVKRYGAFGQCLYVLQRASGPTQGCFPLDLLEKVRAKSLERAFRLFGLQHWQRDIYNAYRGLTSGERGLRADAIEFLDNVLTYEQKRTFLPLLNDPRGEEAMRQMPTLFDVEIRRWPEALSYLLAENDPALKAYALRCIGHAEATDGRVAPDLVERVRAATRHPDGAVQDAARAALSAQASNSPSSNGALHLQPRGA